MLQHTSSEVIIIQLQINLNSKIHLYGLETNEIDWSIREMKKNPEKPYGTRVVFDVIVYKFYFIPQCFWKPRGVYETGVAEMNISMMSRQADGSPLPLAIFNKKPHTGSD